LAQRNTKATSIKPKPASGASLPAGALLVNATTDQASDSDPFGSLTHFGGFDWATRRVRGK